MRERAEREREREGRGVAALVRESETGGRGRERERVGAGGSERELAASSDDAADAICQKISTSSTLTQEAKFRLPQPINASHRPSPPPPSPPSHPLTLSLAPSLLA